MALWPQMSRSELPAGTPNTPDNNFSSWGILFSLLFPFFPFCAGSWRGGSRPVEVGQKNRTNLDAQAAESLRCLCGVCPQNQRRGGFELGRQP